MGWFGKKEKTQEHLNAMLYDAISQNDADGAEKAIFAGASVDGTDDNMPLYWAIRFEREEMIRLLLKHGANPDRRHPEEGTLLFQSMGSWRKFAVIMLEHGADPNFTDAAGKTPLIRAFERYSPDTVEALIAKGADLEKETPEGALPMHKAALFGNRQLMAKMIEKGININRQDKDGDTALHRLADTNGAAMAIFLLSQGADATIANNQGLTPAMKAAKDFSALAAVLRGDNPAAPPQANSAGGWKLIADDEVARVTAKNAIGYRVTELFNFSARTYTQISRNLDTGAESQSVKSFAEVSEGALVVSARAALERLGGHAPERMMDKKKLAQPGAAAGG